MRQAASAAVALLGLALPASAGSASAGPASIFQASALSALVLAAVDHHARGAPLDYIGIAVASAASWVGVPGPGEPVLLAAGVLAARHQLDLATVLVVAWVAATAGGIGGWLLGLKAGRAVVTGPGPLRGLRRRTVAHGEEIFDRHPVTAILITPAFVAGIHGVRSRVYQPINVISAAVWASAIGVTGYLVGPSVLDVFSDVGPVLSAVILIVAIALVGLQVIRHRARRRGDA